MTRLAAEELDGGYRHIGAGANMKLQQFAVVHFIDVIAAENNDVFGVFTLDRIDVLIDRVGCTLIPLFGSSELRRHCKDEFASVIGKDVPSESYVAVQGIGLILREDAYPFELRINTVG
jgi:hypothetical protein